MNFVWNALRSINHNILWIIFLWSALDFFNYVLKKMFRELEKNVVKLVLAQQRMLLFSILDKFDFRCNICTKKLNFCSVVMLSIYFCCALPSDNGAKVFMSLPKKYIISWIFFLKNKLQFLTRLNVEIISRENSELWKCYALTEMVFCYQNCSDLLWEKFVLVIEKIFEIRGWRPRICKNFEITRAIYSNSERSEQFLVTECFFQLVPGARFSGLMNYSN